MSTNTINRLLMETVQTQENHDSDDKARISLEQKKETADALHEIAKEA